jgi:ribosomal 30S subunit maturation factor RimM
MRAKSKHKKEEDAYWEVVERCLIEFHQLEERAARERLADFRIAVSSEKLENPEIVFHNEPFYLACDLMGTRLEIAANQDRYAKILEEVQI